MTSYYLQKYLKYKYKYLKEIGGGAIVTSPDIYLDEKNLDEEKLKTLLENSGLPINE